MTVAGEEGPGQTRERERESARDIVTDGLPCPGDSIDKPVQSSTTLHHSVEHRRCVSNDLDESQWRCCRTFIAPQSRSKGSATRHREPLAKETRPLAEEATVDRTRTFLPSWSVVARCHSFLARPIAMIAHLRPVHLSLMPMLPGRTRVVLYVGIWGS